MSRTPCFKLFDLTIESRTYSILSLQHTDAIETFTIIIEILVPLLHQQLRQHRLLAHKVEYSHEKVAKRRRTKAERARAINLPAPRSA